MQKVPSLPNDWEHWIKKEGLTENFIFYEYTRRGATKGYCTWCEKEVPIIHPKHNQIDRNRMNRLRQKNGGFLYLDLLRYEKKQNTVISDQVIDWMNEQGIKPTELLFIQNYMSAEQVKNYLVRQSAESGESVKGLVTIWEDYLIMAQRMGIDIADPIIYRTRALVQRHNELAQQLGDKNTVEQARDPVGRTETVALYS